MENETRLFHQDDCVKSYQERKKKCFILYKKLSDAWGGDENDFLIESFNQTLVSLNHDLDKFKQLLHEWLKEAQIVPQLNSYLAQFL